MMIKFDFQITVIQQLLKVVMNILIKNDNESSTSSNRQQQKLQSLLHRLSIKIMRSAQTVLQDQMVFSLQSKFQQLVSTENNMLGFLEYFIYSMLNYIDQMQHDLHIDITRKDYEALEASAQRAEAQIRKHIKVQQQLKIFIDGLEEKIVEQNNQMNDEQSKYLQMEQTMKQMQLQQIQLKRRLRKYEDQKAPSKLSNYGPITSQLYKGYYGKNTKPNPKGKHVIDKYNQRIRKLSQKKNGLNIQAVDRDIEISLCNNNITVSKKGSYDQNLKRADVKIQDSSIRQLTKTVEMKQFIHSNQPRKNRQASKYKTQFYEIGQKKQIRSNSVFN